jgi:DNA-binding beta-propeller fold protein YncE
VADVSLPGHATRFDYQSFDPSSGLLYIAHMGDGTLVVFDTKIRRVRSNLAGFPGVTGVRAVPELRTVFASVTRNHEIAAMNTASLEVVRIRDGEFPDGIAYAPAARKVYVSDERGGHETVIDAKTNRRILTIDLQGEVGNTQYDPASQHIFANVQSRNELVEIDPTTDKIVARHNLSGGQGPHGLQIVPSARVAFAACEKDGKVLVVDMETWKVTQTLDAGDDPDVLAFDEGLGILYVARESDDVTVFHFADRQLTKIANVEIGRDAHSVAVNPDTHDVYFPLEDVNGHPLLRIMRPEQ